MKVRGGRSGRRSRQNRDEDHAAGPVVAAEPRERDQLQMSAVDLGALTADAAGELHILENEKRKEWSDRAANKSQLLQRRKCAGRCSAR